MRSVLDSLYASRSSQHLHNDPLSLCHRYSDPRDCEIVAVIASSFAYGAVGVILRTVETICAELGPSPRKYIERLNPAAAVRTFSRFKHRFNDGRDLAALLWGIRQMIEQSGSIQAFFLRGYNCSDQDVESALNCYSAAVLSLDYSALFLQHDIPADSRFPFLFPAPRSGSACKRLCMLLRWLVRPADDIDLGLWNTITPAQLIIPVDTHISRICRYLGLTGRSTADWRMAQEITAALRHFDPADPVKYDFALAHLGISDGCDGKAVDRCTYCSIASICAQTTR
ncbi:MAG: TIGR02757 family protein [Desulfuromonadaceae bacterium]|nr:TIGR02757 family protein [Desulfuromonadaceae bacterium]MDD5104111.1 TIGR02757 family protein [Desulfuromonadaceae bacterium]